MKWQQRWRAERGENVRRSRLEINNNNNNRSAELRKTPMSNARVVYLIRMRLYTCCDTATKGGEGMSDEFTGKVDSDRSRRRQECNLFG